MTAAWAGLIFYLSTQNFGVGFTEWLLREILHLIHIRVSAETFDTLHHLVRKSAHVTEYAIFSTLIYHSLSADGSFRWRWRVGLESLFLAGGYSLTDEFHQFFVPGRTASLVDSSIDTAGATLALALIYMAHRLRRKKHGAEHAGEQT
jgi:VanZ family protein